MSTSYHGAPPERGRQQCERAINILLRWSKPNSPPLVLYSSASSPASFCTSDKHRVSSTLQCHASGRRTETRSVFRSEPNVPSERRLFRVQSTHWRQSKAMRPRAAAGSAVGNSLLTPWIQDSSCPQHDCRKQEEFFSARRVGGCVL